MLWKAEFVRHPGLKRVVPQRSWCAQEAHKTTRVGERLYSSAAQGSPPSQLKKVFWSSLWLKTWQVPFKNYQTARRSHILFVYLRASVWNPGSKAPCNSVNVCFKKIRLVRAIACVPVRYICLCNCVLVSWRGRHTIFIQQLPHRGSQKQVQGHDRDRATAAFCWCNRKLIETINTVLIIKAQVLRWHFADCYSVGSRRKLPQQMSDPVFSPPFAKVELWEKKTR